MEVEYEYFGVSLPFVLNKWSEIRVDIATDVAQAIIRAAEDHDLIVMGASNEWTLRRWLFGSLPDQVANRAPVSVLMVRSQT